jgi:hypothetical protein
MTKPNVLHICRDHREDWQAREMAQLSKAAARQNLVMREYPSDADDFYMVAKPKAMPDVLVIGRKKYDIGTFLLDFTSLDLPHTRTKTSGGYVLDVSLFWEPTPCLFSDSAFRPGAKLWGRVEPWPEAVKALKKAKPSEAKTWLLEEGNLGKWLPMEQIMRAMDLAVKEG